MRTIILTAAAAVLSAGALVAGSVQAMTVTPGSGLRAAIDQTSLVEKARYVCYRVWRHGHLRQECTWRPSYYRYGYPYYSSYGYRPYYYGSYAYRRPGVGFYFRF